MKIILTESQLKKVQSEQIQYVGKTPVSINKPFPKVPIKPLEPWQTFIKAVSIHLHEIHNGPQYADQIVKQILKDCNDFLAKKEIK